MSGSDRHRCAAARCDKMIPSGRLFCRQHQRLVPRGYLVAINHHLRLANALGHDSLIVAGNLRTVAINIVNRKLRERRRGGSA
jgi:hypothetical protein